MPDRKRLASLRKSPTAVDAVPEPATAFIVLESLGAQRNLLRSLQDRIF